MTLIQTNKIKTQMKILVDTKRHLITVPYSKQNILAAGKLLSIKACWWHKTHLDVPKKMVQQVLSSPLVTVVTSKEIVTIIKTI